VPENGQISPAELIKLRLVVMKLSIAALIMVCVLLFCGIVWWLNIPVVLFEVWICAIVFRFAMEPYLQQFNPRWRVLGFVMLLLGIVAVLGFTGLLIAPEANHQVEGLRDAVSSKLPTLWENVRSVIASYNADTAHQVDVWIDENVSTPQKLGKFLSGYASYAPHYVGSAVAVFGYGLLVLLLFMSIINSDYIGWLAKRFGKHELAVHGVLKRTQDATGRWFWTQVCLSSLLGLTIGSALWILGVPFAIAIGVLTVFLDLVPYGNFGALVLALFAVFTDLPNHTFTVNAAHLGLVPVIWFLCTQFSADFLQPRIMNRVLSIHMWWTISFVFLGFMIDGVLGAGLAMPVLIFVKAVFDEIYPQSNGPDQPKDEWLPFKLRWLRRWAVLRCWWCGVVRRFSAVTRRS
jgi:predicted PurR-regulated permease PerM